MIIARWFLLLAPLVLAGCDAGARHQPDKQETAPLPRPDRLELSPAQRRMLPGGGRSAPIKSLIDVRRPMRFGSFVWNDVRVADGPVWVRVDLERQLLSVFRDGDEIGTAVIIYGTDGLPTPRGRFPVLAKIQDHRSSRYDAPMPYTLRLTGDGVSIHGSSVRAGRATHGCVGVPTDFARRLFAAVHRGDPVIIS